MTHSVSIIVGLLSTKCCRTGKLYRIQNVIATADLKHSINVTKFNDYGWGRYDVEANYDGRVGYVKSETMQGRVTVFTTGKLISTGGKSISHSLYQLEHTMNILVRNGFARKVSLQPKIQNLVATADIGSKIDLNRAAVSMPHTIHEPEQFPGLIHKTDGGPTFLIFASGKIVLAGAKSEKNIIGTLSDVLNQLQQFRI